MTPDETIDLLCVAAAFDRRTTGESDVVAWHAAVGDLDFADSRAAVIAHYQESRDWVMPSDVRARVRTMRRGRLAREIMPAPAADLADEPGRYKDALQAGIRQIADGRQVHLAIGRLPSEAPPAIAELRKQLGTPIPPPERLLSPEEIARRQVAESRATRGEPAA